MKTPTPTPSRCSVCGAEIPPGLPKGLCFTCALRGAIEPPASTEQPGERIGRYKLLEKIGEGGCGVVYMAEQEEPVRRRVALKVIKPGMDTREVIARFEAERQALALMEHPHIAKVFDAGATDAGRPYFVMELVRGPRITDYCDQKNLSTRQRLDLFMQVCQAVQHAHQKGIIHRDLKPSNILVTVNDGVPVPKVIDFGIAKATGKRLTDKTLFTAFHQLIGTPAYMSPEQAEMTSVDIDTRSDIYSLGVLLYELLTGRTPFDATKLLQAGMEEMLRTIREQEPVRPSARLSTLAAAEQTTVAQQRQTESPKLIRLLRGDLDWIVMKCLEKDRSRRYETANGLAMDIQRHLQNELVMAMAPSAAYRVTKFVRRHRAALAVTLAIVLLLLTGIAMSTWQAVRATRAEGVQRQLRQQAQTEAAKHAEMARFLRDMLASVKPAAAKGRDTTMLREILDKASERVGKDLKAQPEVEANLRDTLGSVYSALGLYTQAESTYREALVLKTNYWGREHREIAQTLHNLAGVLTEQAKLVEAVAMFREAIAMQTKLFGRENPDAIRGLGGLATALADQGKLAEAEMISREVLAMLKKQNHGDHTDVAVVLGNMATLLHDRGKFDEAETMYREALAMQKRLFGEEHPDVATAFSNLAILLHRRGKWAEAETMSRDALTMQQKLYGSEHPDVATSLEHLASVLQDRGKSAEAETLYSEALRLNEKLLGNEHPNVASLLNNLGTLLHMRGKLNEAEALHRRALAIQKKTLGGQHPRLAHSLENLASVFLDQRKFAEAEAMHREGLAITKKLRGNEHPDVASGLNNLAMVFQAQDKLAEAEPLHREALAMRQRLLGNEHSLTANSLINLGALLHKKGKLAEAESLLRQAVTISRKILGSDHADFVRSLGHFAMVLDAQGNLAEAETVHREELLLMEKLHGHEHADVAKSLNNLALTLMRQERLPEAEAMFREAIALNAKVLEKNHPDAGRGFGNLGAALANQQKWTEAELLLLKADSLLRLNEQADFKTRRDAIERLCVFYSGWAVAEPGTGKALKMLEWQKQLTEFDKSSTPKDHDHRKQN